MSWDDAAQLQSQLKYALDTFNWPQAEALCHQIIERIKAEPEPPPETTAKTLLYDLRRKQCFNLMTLLADALLQSGLRTPQIRRQYAQALIDQGFLTAPELVLQSIIQDSQGIKGEELEARGLMGRIYKQLYVNNNDPRSARNRANLERALNEYLYVYRLGPQDYLWHGINVVALLERARRDDFRMPGLPDASSLAQDILATIDERESQSTEPLRAWDVATRLEAYVALGRHKEAADAALSYVDSIGADAFEINSTVRQLTQVWQLNDKEPPGYHLLPLLTAGYLRKRGAAIQGDQKKIREEAATVGAAAEGELANDQVAWLKGLLSNAGDRRVLLFTHHQLFSWAEKATAKMQSQLAELLASKKLFAWYWGHEHRCVLYDQHPVWAVHGRCVGHSGYPYYRDKFTAGTIVERGPQDSAWRKVDSKHLVPGGLILEGPNPYIPGHQNKYGPQGYMTLELSGEHLDEIVHTPDGSKAYERQLV